MKLYALFALTALALTGCQDATGSDPEIVDSFEAHRNSLRDRPGTTCIVAARGAENAAVTYRKSVRRVRRTGQEAIAEAMATFTTLVAEHNNVITECSGSGENTFTIGGTVSGLAAQNTVGLQNNGADDLLVVGDGQFAFATSLTDGGSYTVTIAIQPNDQSCAVIDGSGTVAGGDVTNVQVQCTDAPTTIGSPANPGDLVVSEVMPNPTAVTDAAGEWFEIHNPTTTTFELMGLVVRDDGSNIFTVDQSLIIQPGAFLAFGRNGDAATNGEIGRASCRERV